MKDAIRDFMYIQDKLRTAIYLNNGRFNKLKILFNKAKDKVELEFTKDKKIDKKELAEKCD